MIGLNIELVRCLVRLKFYGKFAKELETKNGQEGYRENVREMSSVKPEESHVLQMSRGHHRPGFGLVLSAVLLQHL